MSDMDFSELEPKKQITVKITWEQYIALLKLSKIGGLNISQCIRTAIHKELSGNHQLRQLGYKGHNFKLHNIRTGKKRGKESF